MEVSDLPSSGSSDVIWYVQRTKDDFSGVTLTWIVNNGIIANYTRGSARMNKHDPYIWITSKYIFRGPFSSLDASLPELAYLSNTIEVTNSLLGAGSKIVLPTIARVTDTEKYSFLVYKSPFIGTNYTTIRLQRLSVGKRAFTVKISTSTEVMPLSAGLTELARDPNKYRNVIQALQKKGQDILQEVINMYIFGYTNIGMHHIYINFKDGFFFVAGPQNKVSGAPTKATSITFEKQTLGVPFYFAGNFAKKGLPIWHEITDKHVPKVLQATCKREESNEDDDDRRRAACEKLDLYQASKLEKMAAREGWPLQEKMQAVVRIDRDTLLPEYVDDELPIETIKIYELLPGKEGDISFPTQKEIRTQKQRTTRVEKAFAERRGALQKESTIGGMRKLGNTFYTYSADPYNDEDKSFTLANMQYALEVYIRKGNTTKALYAAVEIWRLQEIDVAAYKKLFLTLAVTAYRNIGPANPTLVLSTLFHANNWLPKSREASTIPFVQIFSLIYALSTSRKTRVHILTDYTYSLGAQSLPEEELHAIYENLLQQLEDDYPTQKEFIDVVTNIDVDADKLKYLKIALHYLFLRDEQVFIWLDAYFQPTVAGITGRLRMVSKQRTAVGAVYEVLRKVMNVGDTLTIFSDFHGWKASYQLLVYLCYMCVHDLPLGVYKDFSENLEQLEESGFGPEFEKQLLSGEYEFELDDWAIPASTQMRGTEIEEVNWRKALTFNEDSKFANKKLTQEYLEDYQSMQRDFMP